AREGERLPVFARTATGGTHQRDRSQSQAACPKPPRAIVTGHFPAMLQPGSAGGVQTEARSLRPKAQASSLLRMFSHFGLVTRLSTSELLVCGLTPPGFCRSRLAREVDPQT